MLILGPGGYRFGDYWRMGLPLEILIVAVLTCHGIFPPDGIRVRPKEGTDNEANEIF